VTADWRTFIDRYALALNVEPPSEEEVETVLALASAAAHASERTAAPLSCWLAAKAGLAASEALQAAVALGTELGGQA